MDGIVGNEHQQFCFADPCNVLEALHIEFQIFVFAHACSHSLTLSSKISSIFGPKDAFAFEVFMIMYICSVEACLVAWYSFEEVMISGIFGLLQVLLDQFLVK